MIIALVIILLYLAVYLYVRNMYEILTGDSKGAIGFAIAWPITVSIVVFKLALTGIKHTLKKK